MAHRKPQQNRIFHFILSISNLLILFCLITPVVSVTQKPTTAGVVGATGNQPAQPAGVISAPSTQTRPVQPTTAPVVPPVQRAQLPTVNRPQFSKVTQDPKCLLPVEPGPCRMSLERYYYNSQTNTCETFKFGGCRGNDNKFGFRQTCEEACLRPKTAAASPTSTGASASASASASGSGSVVPKSTISSSTPVAPVAPAAATPPKSAIK